MKSFRRRAYVNALNTVKRPAEQGDKIIIVKPSYTETENGYKIEDIFTVKDVFSESVRTTNDLG